MIGKFEEDATSLIFMQSLNDPKKWMNVLLYIVKRRKEKQNNLATFKTSWLKI